jgi:hypothetical protein
MALDTKQKQGSAIDVGLPWRQWTTEPTASIAESDRLSLAKLCSEPTPTVAANALVLQSQSRRVRAIRRM